MTVVSSASVSAGNLDVVFYEFSAGSGSTWSFDTDAMSGTNAGTTFASSGATGKTRQSNEILIGACAATGTTVTTGDSVGGWTGSVTGLHGWSEYLKVSASSTYTSSFTLGLSGNAWAASIGAWYALAPDIRTNANPMSTSGVSVSVDQMSVSTDVFVQTANNRVTNSGAITCPVALNPSGTGTGNLLVVYIGALASGAIITSVTDDKGNVYTLAFNDTVPTTSLFCYQCLSCIAGVTTVTVLSSAAINANTLDVSVYEMSGLGAWHFDQFAFAGANNSGTTLVSAGTTPATTFANEVVISACFANGTSVTAGTSGFTGGAT